MMNYRAFFEFTSEPFSSDIPHSQILVTHQLTGVQDRIQYAVRLGAAALITGDVGSGKSTALRYVTGALHPSEYKVLFVTASAGSILELYRQILSELGMDVGSSSRAVMIRKIKHEVLECVRGKKMKVILIIDEASLFRLGVFTELHTLTQFEGDSKPFLPLILAGQSNLIDNLTFPNSMPLASRIVGRCHLHGVDRQGMEEYITHHLAIAGVQRNIFEDAAITAIHQGSGCLFRKSNNLARGSIIVAARKKSAMVTAEHVRIAATEIF
jgi:type II secretory pathway predicted ATPase ExeA